MDTLFNLLDQQNLYSHCAWATTRTEEIVFAGHGFEALPRLSESANCFQNHDRAAHQYGIRNGRYFSEAYEKSSKETYRTLKDYLPLFVSVHPDLRQTPVISHFAISPAITEFSGFRTIS